MAQIQLTDEFNSQGGVGGTCYLCNASKRTGRTVDRIITTNLEVDYDAEPGVWPVKWLEFCETCVTEMGHLLGMKTEDEVKGILYSMDDLLSKNADLEQQLKVNIQVVESFKAVLNYLPKPVGSGPVVPGDPRGKTGR